MFAASTAVVTLEMQMEVESAVPASGLEDNGVQIKQSSV